MLTISFLITLCITLAYKFITNQQLVKILREEIKQIQKDMKEHKDNAEKFAEFNKRAMTKNLELMKHSMKPTLFTFIPMLLILSWLSKTYKPAGDLFVFGFHMPLFGPGIGWLVTYILSSLIFSIALRKALKVQ